MPQIFPKWSNKAAKAAPFVLGALLSFVVFVFWYWFSPLNLEVGYMPDQPVPFSHKLHADDLGVDCMYCHTHVDKSPNAGIPATDTCMNCHLQQANKDGIKFKVANESFLKRIPIEWVRVHHLPDYAYFDHSKHINAGVGCVSCHGDVSSMQVVKQTKSLSMGFCLECHRDPSPHLRPKDQVTNMKYVPSGPEKLIFKEKAKGLNPPVENCSGCHR